MRLLLIAFYLGLVFLTIEAFGQETKVNFIIQLNDKLVIDGVAAMHINIETDREKFNLELSYNPGDLIFSEQAYKILKFDSIKSAILTFDLYFDDGGKRRRINVKTSYSKFLMGQSYVILNVYDLRVKKNKQQLGHLTKDDYICEYVFPNGGRLIRKG